LHILKKKTFIKEKKMENIIPRWEWRTFGSEFGDAEKNVRVFPEGKTRESDEIYILSEVSMDNTKIRDGLMDIKTLQQINSDKLEQWMPIMKGKFPINKEEITRVFNSFKVPLTELNKDEYTLDEFIKELINPQIKLKAVNVHKKRTGFTINSCIVEIAEVTVNNIPTRTIAVELEDPQVVITTVKNLGLDKFENINYLTGLKKAVGMK
jgi:exopolyphosphatase / guanosine-5'-triphosphate,3'-diphosphate pyrophosphatase